MNSSGKAIRVTSAGHALFAAALVWLGILGIMKGAFTVIWNPVPKWVPMREALAYLVAFISLSSGVALLLQRTAAAWSRVIFASLAVWVLAMRVPNLFYDKPLVLVAWSFGATAIMLSAAWILYVRLAGERDRAQFGWVAGAQGLRVARILFGLSFVPFGLAHFMYLDATTVLIPNWLPFHVALAYLTGTTFIAGGLAVTVGVKARLAAMMLNVQMALFGLIVWVPRVIAGGLSDFQFGEFVANCVLVAAAWVVVESYSAAP